MLIEMPDELVGFTIRGVALNTENQSPMVLLRNEARDLLLPLAVGPFEASAIIIELENVQPPRPLTHDLLAQVFRRHRLRLVRVEIYGRTEGQCMARLRYRSRFVGHTMEIRPSDGIALAVRLGAPICVAATLIEEIAQSGKSCTSFDSAGTEILYLETEKPTVPLM